MKKSTFATLACITALAAFEAGSETNQRNLEATTNPVQDISRRIAESCIGGEMRLLLLECHTPGDPTATYWSDELPYKCIDRDIIGLVETLRIAATKCTDDDGRLNGITLRPIWTGEL
ncbi:hypothetical protein COV82_04460 [Candidatus Peregrinibacteria bacterium CG11_big_fil_rev_8_21_14_0_20_46_8]|nr:MAG: hypothetical protein COV82_04460 [Candidatus Peregrinibacteria bacterium CG11_big_fil_rev_8_21_14_0_20_46_8]